MRRTPPLPATALFLLATFPIRATAASNASGEGGGLLHREPAGFSLETVETLRSLVAGLPVTLAERATEFGLAAFGLGALVLLALGWGFLGHRRLAERFEALVEPLSRRAPPVARGWIAAGARVFAAALPPLLLATAHAVVGDVGAVEHPAYVVAGTWLLIWAVFATAVAAARQLLVRPLLRIGPDHGRYLYRIVVALLLYAIPLAAALDAFSTLGAPGDVIALLRSAFRLTLIVFLGTALLRKRPVMALFPDVPSRVYRGFVRFLDRAYYPALTLTLATALLALVGYQRLATVLWVNTWVLAALLVGGALAVHFLRNVLRRWILGDRRTEAALAFHRAVSGLLDYVAFVTIGLLALDLTGLREPVVEALSVTIYTAGDRSVTLLLFVVAALIVVAFFLLARLLREYLDYFVYPRLNVEEGVAHAISTFAFYLLIAVGILAAIEAIGLGIGSLTIFAGALGVGIGFGLQNLANNLASGLTLIFSRALRRGDWVTVGDTVGVIQEVGIRATRLRTRDAVEYLVPNADFVAGTIVNWTRTSPDVRLHVPVGVSYGSDPEQVRQILLRVAGESPLVPPTPAPDVWFVGFGESSIDFELLVWANLKQVSEKQVRSDLYFRIFAAFREASVEIPFPQRDLHIKGVVPLRRED